MRKQIRKQENSAPEAQTGQKLVRRLGKPGDSMIMAVLSWVHVWLMFSGSYLLAAGILKCSRETSRSWLAGSLWLLVPAAVSWIYIRKIRSLVVYLLGSAAVTAALWYLTGSIQTTAISAVIFLLRCYTRIEKGRIQKEMQEMPGEAGAQLAKELWEIPTVLDKPVVAHWVLFGAFYIGILLTRQYYMLPWMFYLFLAEVFICFIFSYLDEMRHFITENQRIANLPANRIRRVGAIILGLALILLALTVLPSVLYGREPLTDFLDRLDAREIPPEEKLEDFAMEGGGMGGNIDFSGLIGEEKEPPAWMEALSKVVMFLFSAAVGAGLLIGVYRLCRNTAGYFAHEEEDEVVFLGTDEPEGLGGFFRGGKVFREKRNSPNQKIRRFYRKTLRKKMTERPGGWETPSELEERADLREEESSALLHELYEKARYSAKGCSEEEAGRLKNEFQPLAGRK